MSQPRRPMPEQEDSLTKELFFGWLGRQWQRYQDELAAETREPECNDSTDSE